MIKKGYKIKTYKEMEPMSYKDYQKILDELQEKRDLIQYQMEEYIEYYEDMIENKKESIIEIAKKLYNLDLVDYQAECLMDEFLNKDINIGEKEIENAINEYIKKYEKL